MEVILQENYPALGYVGDRVSVRNGFARNFLIPRGIAIESSSRNERLLRHRLSAINAKKAKIRSQAEEEAKRFEGLAVDLTIKLGKGGKSFGSVTSKDVATALEKEGLKIDRRQIRLVQPLREAGEFVVEIKLHAEVKANLKVRIAAEKPVVVKVAEEGAEGAPKKTRARRSRKPKAGEAQEGGEGAAAENAESADSSDKE